MKRIRGQFRRSFREQTISWLTTAALSRAGRTGTMRKKKIYVDAKSGRKVTEKLVQTGVALAVLKSLRNMIRPVVVEFLKNRLTDFGSQPRPQKISAMRLDAARLDLRTRLWCVIIPRTPMTTESPPGHPD